MKHFHETSAFVVKSGILRMSVYNVYGSQNEFVDSVTIVVFLRMRHAHSWAKSPSFDETPYLW